MQGKFQETKDIRTGQLYSKNRNIHSQPSTQLIGGDAIPGSSAQTVENRLVSTILWTLIVFLNQIAHLGRTNGRCSLGSSIDDMQHSEPFHLFPNKRP